MKKSAFLILLFLSCSVVAQKYYTKTGLTEFKASVEAFEPVEAKNNSTSAVLNIENGDIASLLFVKAFNFRVALMQEHFNENYMDSNKFPKATFRGKVEGFNFAEISDSKKYTLKGTLTVRGVKKDIETIGTFTKQGDKLKLQATFGVKPIDFGIKIPKIVRNKIAGTINITLDYEFVQKK
ncbi:MAG: YceI family protein [Flavobacteriaceae bacterium]